MAARWDLTDRVVLVTGAARGIGLETARRAHARGARVVLTGLEPELLERETRALGDRAAWFEADVTDFDAVDAAVAGTVERFGGIDVVVANAGIAGNGTVRSQDRTAFLRTLDVNLLGVYRTVNAALPHVVERRGYVLTVASLAAAVHTPMAAAYCASKAGVEAFADALRQEVAHTGTAVGCAYFSFIDTDMVQRAFDRRSVEMARERLGRAFSSRAPLSAAADAMIAGIEHRSRTIVAPRWVAAVLRLRTVVQLASERQNRRAGLADIVAQAEREPTELTTEQPGAVTRPAA